MMPLRRASVIVALSLLTSTATAYAECAWVLWEELIISGAEGGASQWRIVNSWPDPAACHAGRGREPFYVPLPAVNSATCPISMPSR